MLARSSQQAIATPSPGHNCAQAEPACTPAPGQALTRACQPSLLLAEPSPGHTSFLQQHHFQGNIQQSPPCLQTMVIPTFHQPLCCYTCLHHTLFEHRSVLLRTLEELFASQLNLGILGKFHKLQSSNSPCIPTIYLRQSYKFPNLITVVSNCLHEVLYNCPQRRGSGSLSDQVAVSYEAYEEVCESA
ncbi:hypothetical protein QL285_030054 [Trifolium repens]|nr:hypothetical protein QL285_030054 [Trifolium repens]